MAKLRIHLLGAPRFIIAQKVVTPGHQKAVALLAYLAINRQPQARETVAALLWPDFDNASARRELRRMLWSLNKSLGKGWLVADRHQVALAEREDLTVDVWQVQAWIDVCLHHGHGVNAVCAECIAPLKAILEQGTDPFLAGFSVDDTPLFERWQRQERERLLQITLQAADKLQVWQVQQEPPPIADIISLGQQRLALDPLHEPTHRLLTSTYTLLGQPAQARHQINASVSALADAYDVSAEEVVLTPPTETIRQQVAQGTFVVTPADLSTIFAMPLRVSHAVKMDYVVASDGQPPSLPATPCHNLPAQMTPFVGRTAELAQLDKLLADPSIRLISIVGPGGMGKTRLAIELARQKLNSFRDGLFMVELAPLTDHANVVPTIADVVGYPLQVSGRSSEKQLCEYLAARKMMLLLDNFEHLLAATSLLTLLLEAAPELVLLVTTRQPLQHPGETLLRLGGMGLPHWAATVDAYDFAAIQLFVQAARRARPDFTISAADLPYVVTICRLVEGMPLGILMAASWITVLDPPEIESELRAGLDILAIDGGGLPLRQRSIRVIFDYSWYRMSPAEQSVFMKCALFRGGFSRDAAREVAGASLRTLKTLHSNSLISRDAVSGKYQVHELLRQYAAERLQASGELAEVQAAHMRYFLQLMALKATALMGEAQLAALKEIEADFENIRAAWRHAVAGNAHDLLDTAVQSMYLFCHLQSRLEDGKELFALIQQISTDHPVGQRAAVRFYNIEDDQEQLQARLIKALEQAEAREDWLEVGYCCFTVGTVAHFVKYDIELALRYYERSATLFRQQNAAYFLARTLVRLGEAYQLLGRVELTRQHLNEAYELQQQIGDWVGASETLRALAMKSYLDADYQQSLKQLEMSFQLQVETNFIIGQASSHLYIGWMKYIRGELAAGRQRVETGLQMAQEVVDYSTQAWCLATLSVFDCFAGDYAGARDRVSQAEAIETDPFRQSGAGNPFLQLTIHWARAMLDLADRRLVSAKQQLLPMLNMALESESQPYLTYGVATGALLLAADDNNEEAATCLGLSHSQPAEATAFMAHWQLVVDTKEKVRAELGEAKYQAACRLGRQQNLLTSSRALVARLTSA